MINKQFLKPKTNIGLKRERIYKLIKNKVNDSKLLYIFAPGLWGKTDAVYNYVNSVWKKDYYWIEIDKNHVNFNVLSNQIKDEINKEMLIIIDNIELLNDEQIVGLVEIIKSSNDNYKFILIGEDKIHRYFGEIIACYKVNVIDANDLSLTSTEIKKLFLGNGINLDENEIKSIKNYSKGWPCIVWIMLNLAFHNNSIVNVLNKSSGYIDNFIEKTIWTIISADFRLFLICISNLEYIPIELCEAFIKNKPNKNEYKFSKILMINEYGYYTMTERIREFIKLKEDKYENDLLKKVYSELAEWFYNHGYEIEAVKLYLKIKDFNKIDSILKKSTNICVNSLKISIIGSYIKNIPSDILNKYQAIKNFLNIYKRINIISSNSDYNELLISKSMLNVIKIEEEYECGNIEKSLYMLLNELKSSDNLEKIVILNIQLHKILCIKGDKKTADKILHDIKETVVKKGIFYLIPYVNNCIVQSALLNGKIDRRKKNLIRICESTYSSMEYYKIHHQLIQVKICISEGEYNKAIIIIENIHNLVTNSDLDILKIQYCILKSIILFNNNLRKESFVEMERALQVAQYNKYIRVFADEGEQCYKVLNEYMKYRNKLQKNKRDSRGKRYSDDDIEALKSEYISIILKNVREFSILYPDYLAHYTEGEEIKITKSEFTVLKLLNRGMSNKEIGEYLNIKIDTVKFHTKNIYLKLGVKNRLEAVKVARTKNII